MADARFLHVLVEGQTEETLVRNVLDPELRRRGLWVTWSTLKTKQPVNGPAHRGGVSKWSRLEREIRLLLGNTRLDVLTTMIDYYALPPDVPGMATRPDGDPYRRVAHVEAEIESAVGDLRFVPHLVLHETESWVYAAAEQLGDLYGDPWLAATLRAEADAAGGPELVNDGPATAPSKRLVGHRPDYSKVNDGPLAVSALGLVELRRECPHADAWLRRLGA